MESEFIGIIQLGLWLLMGYWGYRIMEKKNRNGGVGAALGILLGLIGILICYLHSDKPKTDDRIDILDR